MDYVGPLILSTFINVTYRYILVFINRLTKMQYLVPVTLIEVEEYRNIFYRYVFSLYRLPEILVSDRST